MPAGHCDPVVDPEQQAHPDQTEPRKRAHRHIIEANPADQRPHQKIAEKQLLHHRHHQRRPGHANHQIRPPRPTSNAAPHPGCRHSPCPAGGSARSTARRIRSRSTAPFPPAPPQRPTTTCSSGSACNGATTATAAPPPHVLQRVHIRMPVVPQRLPIDPREVPERCRRHQRDIGHERQQVRQLRPIVQPARETRPAPRRARQHWIRDNSPATRRFLSAARKMSPRHFYRNSPKMHPCGDRIAAPPRLRSGPSRRSASPGRSTPSAKSAPTRCAKRLPGSRGSST